MPGLYARYCRHAQHPGSKNVWLGFALGERSMPLLYKTTLRSWYKKHNAIRRQPRHVGRCHLPRAVPPNVYLFCDEFTNYNDVEIGIKAILLLERLGYEVILPEHLESGRTWLSKGLVREAKKIANQNIRQLQSLITANTPLIGIEPSAILAFKDEYPDLADDDLLDTAKDLAQNAFLIDDFLAREIDRQHIHPGQFTTERRSVMLHGHCQQKALSSVAGSVKILSLPANYSVTTVPSGCCGMAGSFGYEKEHYPISQQIGELVLLPAVRSQGQDVIISAPGTSCRHQIKDGNGTGR